MEVEWYLHSDHRNDFFCRIEELPAGGDKWLGQCPSGTYRPTCWQVQSRSFSRRWTRPISPPSTNASYRRCPPEFVDAFVGALFEAFRDRGSRPKTPRRARRRHSTESRSREPGALTRLLAYARTNPDLLNEATATSVQHVPTCRRTSPGLREALAARLASAPP